LEGSLYGEIGSQAKINKMKKLKILLVVFILSWVTLLSSCLFPGPGYGSRGGGNEYHGQKEHHGNNSHHNYDNHRDNDDHHDN